MRDQPIFTTGGALRIDYPHYVVRPADQVARRALHQGKLIYTIGPRQMGKTSLLKRLGAGLERQGWRSCFVDLATLRNLERPRWFRHLGETIGRACGLLAVRSPLQDQQDFRIFLLDEIGLRWNDAPVRLALFLDEVEGLFGLSFSDDFLMTMRDLYQQRDLYYGQLLVAFSGAADPASLVKDPSISPFNIAEEIMLHDFSATESRGLTEKLELLGLPLSGGVHDRIYAWAAGQPYLTQRICELIEESAELGRIAAITPETVDQTVANGLLALRSRDKNIKHVLSEITNPTASPPRLWARLLAGEPVYATEPGFYRLYLTGAIAEQPDGRVAVRNRIYRVALGIETRRPATPAVINGGRAWALLVGVNHYDDPYIADLTVCGDDVAAVQQALAPHFQASHLLTDATPERPPTRANLLSTLAALAQAAAPEDLLLFYFSGHGMAEAGESYLLPRDARLAALRHTALAMHDLRDLFDQSAARARVIILDACHSGADLGKTTPLMTPEFIQRVFAEAEGMAVLSSCKQGQRSWEWPQQRRSVFTYYLLEALSGQADPVNKGFVTVSDVSAYVSDRVRVWAAEHQVLQTPTLQYTVAGDIVLHRYTQV